MRYLVIILVLLGVIITVGCVNENQKTSVTPTLAPSLSETVTIPLTTSQVNQKGIVKNGIIIFGIPEKITRPEDLQIGDLIQMSSDDSSYDKEHGFIIKNISPQNNQFLINEIFKREIWYSIEPQSSKSITSGALMRDYPNKIGHASEPLPEICMTICWDNKSCSNNSIEWDLGCGSGSGTSEGNSLSGSFSAIGWSGPGHLSR